METPKYLHVNGALVAPILHGLQIACYAFKDPDWSVLIKDGTSYISYDTDEFGVFAEGKKYKGTITTVLKLFKVDTGILSENFLKSKGYTRADYLHDNPGTSQKDLTDRNSGPGAWDGD